MVSYKENLSILSDARSVSNMYELGHAHQVYEVCPSYLAFRVGIGPSLAGTPAGENIQGPCTQQ